MCCGQERMTEGIGEMSVLPKQLLMHSVCVVLLQLLIPVWHFSEKKGNFSCFLLFHWSGS